MGTLGAGGGYRAQLFHAVHHATTHAPYNVHIALNVRHMPYITFKHASSAVSSVLAKRIVYTVQCSDGAVSAGNALTSEN